MSGKSWVWTLGIIFVFIGACSSNSSDSTDPADIDGDLEIADQDKSEKETNLIPSVCQGIDCSPGTCKAVNGYAVCDCPQGYIQQDKTSCVEISVDGDVDVDFDPDPDLEADSKDDSACEQLCDRFLECGKNIHDNWIVYYPCTPTCESDELNHYLMGTCIQKESCDAFLDCARVTMVTEPYQSECMDLCDLYMGCNIEVEFTKEACDINCDWQWVDWTNGRVEDCLGYTDCQTLDACLHGWPGDEDDEFSRDAIEYEYDGAGEPSVSNCWHHPEMVPVDGRFCIDKFESVLMEHADCTGNSYGQQEDNYPAGFPDEVDCPISAEDWFCSDSEEDYLETVPVYACSSKGVIPSRFITWFQARKACMNVGKLLCEETDWVQSCEGPNGKNYPYGNEYVKNACWDNTSDNGGYPSGPTLTGSKLNCLSDYGAFDLLGNVSEWIGNETTSSQAYDSGGEWLIG